jgi:hypothetical protein
MADNNFLFNFPWLDEMKKSMSNPFIPDYREVNGHIHTPYSFSAFDDMETIFRMATQEHIAVLGINDFFVADGYDAFYKGCVQNNIFPEFGIEFIGLLKEEQKKGIRINDPNNPGRIYFTGKGLDYPFSLKPLPKRNLNKTIRASQEQIRAMSSKINILLNEVNPALSLSFEDVRDRFAMDLVRERHLARAIRAIAEENYSTPAEQLHFIESLYSGKKSTAGMENHSALENEIRANLLKAGGRAFVEEDQRSFPSLKKIIRIIRSAGGIPCYPVLLDDISGNCTEFESDPEKLLSSLSSMGIWCIELIPGRNEISRLKSFVEFFDNKGFIIIFGTEHNTPEMIPLTVKAREETLLDDSLKRIAWEGACVVAAHQYLRAQGRQGYVLSDGTPSHDQKDELAKIGKLIIEYFLIRKKDESAN